MFHVKHRLFYRQDGKKGKTMDERIICWYDDEEDIRVQLHFWYSNNGYCYKQYCFSDGTSSNIKRISEKEYISLIEQYYNA